MGPRRGSLALHIAAVLRHQTSILPPVLSASQRRPPLLSPPDVFRVQAWGRDRSRESSLAGRGVCVCVCDVRVMRGVLRHSTSGVPARWRWTRAKSARTPRKVKQRTHSPLVLGLTDRPAHLLDRS